MENVRIVEATNSLLDAFRAGGQGAVRQLAGARHTLQFRYLFRFLPEWRDMKRVKNAVKNTRSCKHTGEEQTPSPSYRQP